MLTNETFAILDNAPYGAYAVGTDQVIRYWNATAERILGYTAEEVVGRRCYEVLQHIPVERSRPFCVDDCPTIRTGLEGQVPQVTRLVLRDVAGRRKRVAFTPLYLPALEADPKLLVFLFHEDAAAGQGARTACGEDMQEPFLARYSQHEAHHGMTSYLTAREREVLRLVAVGLSTREIASALHLSAHTVRNHLSNIREKLQARSKLEAVLVAQHLGELEPPLPPPRS